MVNTGLSQILKVSSLLHEAEVIDAGNRHQSQPMEMSASVIVRRFLGMGTVVLILSISNIILLLPQYRFMS